jgi:hypothetical protein
MIRRNHFAGTVILTVFLLAALSNAEMAYSQTKNPVLEQAQKSLDANQNHKADLLVLI